MTTIENSRAFETDLAPRPDARPAHAQSDSRESQGRPARAASRFDSHGQVHDVRWLASDEVAAGPFIDALSERFGTAISSSLVREFKLGAAPGHRLPALTVEQAIDAAETSQQALAGVDFLTQLECSAARGGLAFCRAAQELALAPERLDAVTRRRVDQHMAEHFARAAGQGAVPVDPAQAYEWLKKALTLLTN